MLSSIGLPGTNGFIGEFLVLLGAFRAKALWGVLASLGVILSAVYMLWMFMRVIFGPVTKPENEKLVDLSMRERLVFAPLVILILWIGFAPQPLINRFQPALDRTLALSAKRAAQAHAMAAQAAMPVAAPAASPDAGAVAAGGRP
jgi:NADH-quinone oxidoreductase subunit M